MRASLSFVLEFSCFVCVLCSLETYWQWTLLLYSSTLLASGNGFLLCLDICWASVCETPFLSTPPELLCIKDDFGATLSAPPSFLFQSPVTLSWSWIFHLGLSLYLLLGLSQDWSTWGECYPLIFALPLTSKVLGSYWGESLSWQEIRVFWVNMLTLVEDSFLR